MYTGRTRDRTPWDKDSAREISAHDRGPRGGDRTSHSSAPSSTTLASRTASCEQKIRSAVCLPSSIRTGSSASSTPTAVSSSAVRRGATGRCCAPSARTPRSRWRTPREHGEIHERRDRLVEQNLSCSSSSRTVHHGQDGEPEQAHAGGILDTVARIRRRHLLGPDPRRERHRQGAARARHPRPEPAQRRPVRGGQLPRRMSPRPGGERAVRAPQGRVHRRGLRQARATSRWPTAARCSWTRSARCPRHAGQAAARAAGRRSDAASARTERVRKVDVRVVAATNRDLRAMVAGRASSARTSTTGFDVVADPRCRRCASAARTFSRSPSTS